MSFEAALVGEGEHLVVNAHGIADAEHVDPTIDQLFRDPVHRHIALCAHQHLTLAVQCLVDGLDERGGLARAGRTVHDGYVFGPEHLVDGMLLCTVQIGEVQVGKGERLGTHAALALVWRRGIEEIAQIAQATLGAYGAFECIEHHAIAGLIEGELNAEAFLREGTDGETIRHMNNHTVAIDEGDGALE